MTRTIKINGQRQKVSLVREGVIPPGAFQIYVYNTPVKGYSDDVCFDIIENNKASETLTPGEALSEHPNRIYYTLG